MRDVLSGMVFLVTPCPLFVGRTVCNLPQVNQALYVLSVDSPPKVGGSIVNS
jgi:hypothetical protein